MESGLKESKKVHEIKDISEKLLGDRNNIKAKVAENAKAFLGDYEKMQKRLWSSVFKIYILFQT